METIKGLGDLPPIIQFFIGLVTFVSGVAATFLGLRAKSQPAAAPAPSTSEADWRAFQMFSASINEALAHLQLIRESGKRIEADTARIDGMAKTLDRLEASLGKALEVAHSIRNRIDRLERERHDRDGREHGD